MAQFKTKDPGYTHAVLALLATGGFACVNICIASYPGLHLGAMNRQEIFAASAVATTGAFAATLGLLPGRERVCRRVGASVAVALLSFGLAAFGALGSIFMYFATLPDAYSHGRRLRRLWGLATPDTQPCDAWLQRETVSRVGDPEIAKGVGAEWRNNAGKEHASIASFAQLSLDLLAVGAPPELLAAVQSDICDEIRHTRICYSIARDFDGRAEGPKAFPEARRLHVLAPSRTVALAQIAIDAVIDGALNEGVSARILARLSARAIDPDLQAQLRNMAGDEARHAAHSWDVVRFCIEAGGEPVREALRGALRRLPTSMHAPLPAGARDGAWEPYGVQGLAMERECWERARAQATRRLGALLSSPPHESATAA